MSDGIHIKKKNRGKFTATKKRTGKSTEELTHSKNPLTRKRAIFAQNARKWNHKGGKNEGFVRLTRNKLYNLVCEVVENVLGEGGKYETWYRGYESKYGSQRGRLLWLTDDISYARAYGNRVEEIIIDTDKINPISLYETDDLFDYYDGPSDNDVEELLSDGYNCYFFHANNDNSYCMCLWDKSPIVSRRELSKEEFEDIESYEGYDNPQYDDYK